MLHVYRVLSQHCIKRPQSTLYKKSIFNTVKALLSIYYIISPQSRLYKQSSVSNLKQSSVNTAEEKPQSTQY